MPYLEKLKFQWSATDAPPASLFGEKRLGALQVSLLVLDQLVEVRATGLNCLTRGFDCRLSLHIIQDRLGLGQQLFKFSAFSFA